MRIRLEFYSCFYNVSFREFEFSFFSKLNGSNVMNFCEYKILNKKYQKLVENTDKMLFGLKLNPKWIPGANF